LSKTPDLYLKDKNRKWLIAYLLFNAVLFAIFSGLVALSIQDINELIDKLKSPSGFFPLLGFPLAIVLEGLIHPDYKAVLVFLRIKNPLPGCRAFSIIAKKDTRVDFEKLTTKFPDGIPKDPEQQNKYWYKLYRECSDKLRVLNSYKVFLLTRDLASLTAVLIPICFVAHLIWDTTWPNIIYHLILLFTLLILIIIAAQNYGKRFVANVLVEATL
jgi:hypothetical protein